MKVTKKMLIEQLRARGFTYQQIGYRMGISRQRVEQIFHPAYQKAYQKTDKFKAYQKAYQKTDKFKAYQKAYYLRKKKLSK